MQLVRSSPFRELVNAEKEFSKILDQGWSFTPMPTNASTVDMYVDDDKLTTEVALPDFKKGEIEVTANSEGLEISAVHKEKEEETKNRRYLLRESSQSYWRHLSLPPDAKTDKIKCVLKDGKLTITIPMAKQNQTKTIEIE